MASVANKVFRRAASSASEAEENHTMLQGFEWATPGHGTHWNKLTELAPTLAEMGVTALWIPPPTKAAGAESVGYDTYDLWDLGEFTVDRDRSSGPRTKYGTRAELEKMMHCCREKGIAIYVDAVLNHKMGSDGEPELFKVVEVDQNDRDKVISKEPFDIKGYTRFDFPQRNAHYSDFHWSFEHFTGVDFDAESKRSAIFKILGDSKDWAEGVDTEHGNYDYLMGADVAHAHPDVSGDMMKWGDWMLKTFPISGFRFDAVKHISREFISAFVKHVRQVSRDRATPAERAIAEDGPHVFAVGEFWKDSLEDCVAFLDSLGTQFSLFDAPLHYNFKEAGDQGENFDLRKIFDGTLLSARPIDAVTLVDNHDTQPGQALESWVSPSFKPLAYAFILLREQGYPCVFWGDLYGCEKDGDTPASPPVSSLEKFIAARSRFAFGPTEDYLDHPQCVGWVRKGNPTAGRPDGLAVVLCNSHEDGWKHMKVGREHANETWVDFLGWHEGEVRIDGDGFADFKCHSRSVSIWTRKGADSEGHFTAA